MKKNLMIINILFGCSTIIPVLFGLLIYFSVELNLLEHKKIFDILLAIFGLGSYLGVFIVGCFLFYLGRGNGLVNPLIKVDAILDVVIGFSYIISTILVHALGYETTKLSIYMVIGTLILVVFDVIAYKLGTNCCSNDI